MVGCGRNAKGGMNVKVRTVQQVERARDSVEPRLDLLAVAQRASGGVERRNVQRYLSGVRTLIEPADGKNR